MLSKFFQSPQFEVKNFCLKKDDQDQIHLKAVDLT